MNNTVKFTCPKELLLGLHCDAEEFAAIVQLETAISLFKAGKISSGLAAKWLEMPRVQFLNKAFEAGAELLSNSEDDFFRETKVLL